MSILDPVPAYLPALQGGVSIPAVRKIVGDKIALIENVNCGLLHTGTDEECDADVLRTQKFITRQPLMGAAAVQNIK